MSDLRKAAELALEALDCEPESFVSWTDKLREAREALRQALAQPPCQTGSQCIGGKCPECEWVGLTDEEVEAWRGNYDFFDSALVREVEAKLKEKNSG